jgi:hypothetical protein
VTRVESPVWDDVMRVWLDPYGVVEAGRRDGRSWPDWWRALALLALGLGFSMMLHQRLGVDQLIDSLLWGDEPTRVNPGIQVVFTAASLGATITMLLVQWLVLPVVSRLFGGSPSRRDANLAVYFLFCAGFLMGFAIVAADLVSVISQRIWPVAGPYLALSGAMVVLALVAHQGTRLTMLVLALGSYPRGMAVLTISFAAGFLAASLFFSVVLLGTLSVFPDMLE